MTFVDYNIVGLIKQYLGYLLRGLLHYAIALLWPLIELWDMYAAWRTASYYQANLSSQTISIEGNLNKLFDASLQRITIEDGMFDPMIYLPYTAAEGTELLFPLDDAEDTELYIAINEFERIGEADFDVHIPNELNLFEDEIKGVVNLQKLAGKIYQITYY